MNKKRAFKMIAICPSCKNEYDVTGLDIDVSFHCSCGAYVISPSGRMILKINDTKQYKNRSENLKRKKEDKL